ncbi:uncharacterized protein LOC114930709 [Nylanderia fulva]|uniref:uncharacterized protein LOC114930709 n=1 Tax=Nylanderia fulva TaxID=613905 RepID=UPI0010FB21D4|nr:uncharacterized protein LOC114930709 [Nylanderia fulva]
MIIPAASWLTRLVIDSCHRRTLHGGVQLTLGLLRLRFGCLEEEPPSSSSYIDALPALDGVLPRHSLRWVNLPRDRVTPTRPFLSTGVDYAGPILLRTSKGRGHRAHKGYIAVFICFWSKATHLEVVSDYTSEAFIAALHRFVSRRGLCAEIYSDCATAEGHRIVLAATAQGIRWHFNPPAAPHFGGLWEAAVKSTKFHLRRVIGETTLTFEELSTLLARSKLVLILVHCRHSQMTQRTFCVDPGHFLVGAPLLAVPEPSLTGQTVPTCHAGVICSR